MPIASRRENAGEAHRPGTSAYSTSGWSSSYTTASPHWGHCPRDPPTPPLKYIGVSWPQFRQGAVAWFSCLLCLSSHCVHHSSFSSSGTCRGRSVRRVLRCSGGLPTSVHKDPLGFRSSQLGGRSIFAIVPPSVLSVHWPTKVLDSTCKERNQVHVRQT